MNHFNKLTPAEAERLALLLEEMGEAQQAIGKILRHGYESQNPFQPGPTNRDRLEKELGDVQHAIDLLCRSDVNRDRIDKCEILKRQAISQYLHHQ